MATKHRTKKKKQTAIQTTETMSNTGLTKYYEADEWTKMMVKGKYFLRERGCLRIFHLYNSYMISIIRNPIVWLGISAYWGGVFVSLFFKRRSSPDYFFRNVSKMAAWIPDNKKK